MKSFFEEKIKKLESEIKQLKNTIEQFKTRPEAKNKDKKTEESIEDKAERRESIRKRVAKEFGTFRNMDD